MPPGWTIMRIEDAYVQLPVGQRYDSKSVSDSGRVPVLDQSQRGVLGYHDDPPGVDASSERPVVTFANHTCAMRVVRSPFSVIQNVFPLVGRSEVCDTLFLYYATNGRQQTEEYKGHHPAWRRSYFGVPGLEVQEKIAGVLSGFDSLIENNRRRVELLEEMARTIYREWFVHFRYPGHDGVKFVDSAHGSIPDGWAIEQLREIADLSGGSTRTKASYVEAGYVAFSAAGPDGHLPDFEIEGSGVVLSAVGARCGRTFRASGKWSSIANTIKIVPRSGKCGPCWLYLATDDPTIWPKRGSAQPFVSINDARGVQVLAPDATTVARFEAACGSLDSAAEVLRSEMTVVASVRDLLLIKLVTGQIDVSSLDLDALVESSVA